MRKQKPVLTTTDQIINHSKQLIKTSGFVHRNVFFYTAASNSLLKKNNAAYKKEQWNKLYLWRSSKKGNNATLLRSQQQVKKNKKNKALTWRLKESKKTFSVSMTQCGIFILKTGKNRIQAEDKNKLRAKWQAHGISTSHGIWTHNLLVTKAETETLPHSFR